MAGIYERLITFLDESGARYRLIDHPPEGRTDFVSKLRGHAVREAAKCLVLLVKRGRKDKRYVLAVIPGDRRVDFDAVKRVTGGSYVGFVDGESAEALSGCVVGTVLPFAFDDRLQLIVDPALREASELFFNAGRLDRSIALDSADYFRLTAPRVEAVSIPAQPYLQTGGFT